MSIVFVILCGVLLPLASIAFECGFHLCASAFFDPLPTWGHVLYFGCIPVANLMSLSGVLYQEISVRVERANMVSLAVSGLYTLLFIPIMPISVIAILFNGIGLFGLCPLLAFFVAVYLRRRISAGKRPAERNLRRHFGVIGAIDEQTLLQMTPIKTRSYNPWILIGTVLALPLAQFPRVLTCALEQLVQSPAPATQWLACRPSDG